jgi:hypothetical protein
VSVGVGGVGGDNGPLYQGLRDTAERGVADGIAAAARRIIKQPNGDGSFRYSFDGGRTWAMNKGGEVGSGVQYHSSGGVHGMHPGSPKGTDTTPAWLTPGEFVMQKSAVQSFGLPFMNALNNQQTPKYLAMGGSTGRSVASSGPSIQIVELLPNQLDAIVRGVSSTLILDGKMVAEATNNANAVSARRGSN